MRWWVGAVATLFGVSAHATAPQGVPPQWTFPVSYTTLEATDAGPGVASLYAELEADVTAVLLYVDSVDAPGMVQVQLFAEALTVPLKVGTGHVVGPGWAEFSLVGAPAGTHRSYRLELTSGDARVRFRHVSIGPYGLDLRSAQTPLARLKVPPGLLSTGVFRLASGNDPLADPSCGVQGAVAGSPYAFARSVALDAGPQTQVALAWAPHVGEAWGAGLGHVAAATDGGIVQWALGYDDGGTTPIGSLALPGPYPALFVAAPGDRLSPPFRLIAQQGAGEWLLVSSGPGLDVCHPAVRASFGGTRAHAVGWEEGADFVVWFYLRLVPQFCRDDDGDGRGGALGCEWWGGGQPPGLVYPGDCDDSNPATHPGAQDRCDGIDNDCDGTVDNGPGIAADAPLCGRQSGPCEGARMNTNRCVDGGWLGECGPESYGYWFGESEACRTVDLNCDGVISREMPCERQAGVCKGAMVSDCSAYRPAECRPDRYGPDFEFIETRCDGLDNNCNGRVDDVELQACPLQKGVCWGSARTSRLCVDGGWLDCGPAQYGRNYEAVESKCDGLDNDCDGLVDRADPDLLLCERQLGVCAGARHAEGGTCATVLEPCTAAEYGARWQPEELRCDGLDNDCDGIADEGCVPPRGPPPTTTGGSHCGCTALDVTAFVALAVLLRRRRAVRASPAAPSVTLS